MLKNLAFLNKNFSLHLWPGIVILALSMLGIYVASTVHHEYTLLHEQFADAIDMVNFDDSGTIDEKKALEARANYVESSAVFAYWCVTFLGLCGFLMLLLTANKLADLEVANKKRASRLEDYDTRFAAMEAILEGVALIKDSNRIYYLNNAILNLFGIREFERDDYIGEEWIKLLPENLQVEAEEEAFLALEQGRQWSMEVSVRRYEEGKDLNQTARLLVSLIKAESGEKIFTAQDITQRLEADTQRKEIQSQLHQAQKMEAIGRLAGGIAHDFNNILAAMNGYAEFLIEDLDKKSPQYTFAENIMKAGQQARSLVDQMLTFSRYRSSEIDVIDVMNPVNECLSMLRASLPKTVEMVTDLDLPVPKIEGNETQISQVLMNLCVNAKDAMADERGYLKVDVKKYSFDDAIACVGYGDEGVLDKLPDAQEAPLARIRDKDAITSELLLGSFAKGHNYVRIGVEDSGSGISRSIMEYIFEPFFTTKPVNKGTGLGLSTAHGVIAAHRGVLYLTSTIGKGTRFEIYFPVTEKAMGANILNAEGGGELIPAKILLVEDQPEVMDITCKMLERLQCEVFTAENGIQAMAVLREHDADFDLVVTDQNMPKMTGLEMIYQANLEYPELPFVLLSGYSEQKLQDIMQEHPAIKAIIRKPIRKAVLGEKIAYVLSLSEIDVEDDDN
ncbi:MAG: response regulator [Micavibrio sp.]|nr:response regulator [Micavibrio sp.]